MAKLLRNDNTSFIVPDYREQLADKKISILKNEVGLLSKSYGNLIYIQKSSNNNFEVAFSNDAGYLLAESVSKHLNSSNFIYIEQLEDTDTALFVAVKAGNVYIDTQIPVDTVADELIIIQTEQTKYDFYVSANIPVSNNAEENEKLFVGDISENFTVLKESVFNSLEKYDEFKLENINEAFLKAALIKKKNKKVIASVSVFCVLILAWLLWPSHKAPTGIKQIKTITVKSKYYDYVQLLKSPGPIEQTNGLIKFLHVLQGLPAGWSAKTIAVSPKNIRITIKNIGNVANLENLYDWTSAKNINMKVYDKSVILNFNTAYPNQSATAKIYPSEEVLRVLLDRITPLLKGNAISIARKKYLANYNKIALTINFSNTDLSMLNTIVTQFSGLPLTFQTISLNTNNVGLYSGSMNITIIGN